MEAQPSEAFWKSRPVYTRVTAVGLLVYAAIFLLVGILGAIGGDAGTLVFLGIFAILSLVFAGLAWRFGRWLLILAAVWPTTAKWMDTMT